MSSPLHGVLLIVIPYQILLSHYSRVHTFLLELLQTPLCQILYMQSSFNKRRHISVKSFPNLWNCMLSQIGLHYIFMLEDRVSFSVFGQRL